MTPEEYEAMMRRLKADAENARKAYIRARGIYDGICNDMRNLRVEWQAQQDAADPTTEK
ncbi:hypothetical protein [Streptomyces sp. NPDC007088]|uniref:hypothetical protein n=1 Tax=Streptomyces sp. NPDC007088 TaxID=3364773 RepID=UPI0036AED659